jgi:hypothetical protein
VRGWCPAGEARHLLYLVVAQPVAVLDGDHRLLARGELLGRDRQDAVRVDVEGDLDLRLALLHRRDPAQLELA